MLAAFFVSWAVQAFALSTDGAPQQLPIDPQPLTITSKTGEHRYLIEIADNGEERSIGLMYRKTIAANQGMLFDFQLSRGITMWMKNTFIPLDIIFINDHSRISAIRANTEPQSLAIIGSGGAARFALELKAGAAKASDLRVGDVVRHRVIDAATLGK